MAEKPDPGSVVVTGAASGIGLATVRLLVASGHHVLAWDSDITRAAEISGDKLAVETLDVRNRAAMDRALAAAEGRFPPVTGLVSCAAIFRRRPFLELDEESWNAHFSINLKGSLLACQAVLPGMRRRGSGSIVLMSSTLARTGSPTGVHYAATKGGILGLARSLALEVAREGIRVNVVSPGLADTPQPRGHGPEEELLARAKKLPMGRMATPQEIAEAALFLLGPESAFMTGQDLPVNGGLL